MRVPNVRVIPNVATLEFRKLNFSGVDFAQEVDQVFLRDVEHKSAPNRPCLKEESRRCIGQLQMTLGAGDERSSAKQEYNPTPIIHEIRAYVETWRKLKRGRKR